eukprot:scaffold392_cov350-Prasinococcus_capsulatus_cf.AAC.3
MNCNVGAPRHHHARARARARRMALLMARARGRVHRPRPGRRRLGTCVLSSGACRWRCARAREIPCPQPGSAPRCKRAGFPRCARRAPGGALEEGRGNETDDDAMSSGRQCM